MNQHFTTQGSKVLELFSQQLEQSPAYSPVMLIALNFWLGPTQEIVIAGNRHADDTKEMINLVRERFLPNTVVLPHEQGKAGKAIEEILPFVRNQTAIDNKATAYVGKNYVCNRPVNNIKELKRLLAGVVKRSEKNQDARDSAIER